MHRRLDDQQIRTACRDLVRERRRVSVRMLMDELRRRHGAAGRTERVAKLLRAAEVERSMQPIEHGSEDLEKLREQVRDAEARAQRAEQLERDHQDFWARRYSEKVDEVERRYAAALKQRAPISADQHLRLHQQIAELTRRLKDYERASAPDGGESRALGQSG